MVNLPGYWQLISSSSSFQTWIWPDFYFYLFFITLQSVCHFDKEQQKGVSIRFYCDFSLNYSDIVWVGKPFCFAARRCCWGFIYDRHRRRQVWSIKLKRIVIQHYSNFSSRTVHRCEGEQKSLNKSLTPVCGTTFGASFQLWRGWFESDSTAKHKRKKRDKGKN